MYGKFYSIVFLVLLLTGLLAGALNAQQLGTNEKVYGRTEGNVGSSVAGGQGSSDAVTQSTVGWRASELSWALGKPFPATNGCTMFPPLPPQEPAEGYYTHWYAGSIYPSSLAPQYASSISMSITVPLSEPRPEEFYYVILSAFDSNRSYDQIGFSACFGTWGLSYSWTSGSPYPGGAVYHYDPIAMVLSPGATYTFNVTTQAGVTHFIAYQGGSEVWSLDALTGGNYLILSNYYSSGIRGRAPYDYTDYEEVWQTSTPEGAPDFDFTFSNNSWISTSGGHNAAMWTPWYSPDKPFQIPSSVQVVIRGSSVLVRNPGTWWPMFRHDPTHAAYSASTAPTTNQTLEWSYKTGASVDSSPAVADGVVYVGSDDGNVYALNASTGALVWRYKTAILVRSSPAVANGVVYVGSYDRDFYALNASTGARVWYTGNVMLFYSPAVADGVVYVGSVPYPPGFNATIRALNASTGMQVWSYASRGGGFSSPSVAGGVVFVGCGDNKTYALNATNGAFLWRYKTGWTAGSPAVVDGVVFVGSEDGSVYALGPRPFAHDVAVTNVTPSKTVIDQGFNDSVKVTVANQGGYTETFNVTAYATVFFLMYLNITIASQNITLASGNSAIISFTWNTADFPYGYYNVSAYAWPVPGETDTANNNFRYGAVCITITGDINGDFRVGTVDLQILGVNWGLTVPPADPNADINCDGIVNTKDLHILGVNWGIWIVLPG